MNEKTNKLFWRGRLCRKRTCWYYCLDGTLTVSWKCCPLIPWKLKRRRATGKLLCRLYPPYVALNLTRRYKLLGLLHRRSAIIVRSRPLLWYPFTPQDPIATKFSDVHRFHYQTQAIPTFQQAPHSLNACFWPLVAIGSFNPLIHWNTEVIFALNQHMLILDVEEMGSLPEWCPPLWCTMTWSCENIFCRTIMRAPLSLLSNPHTWYKIDVLFKINRPGVWVTPLAPQNTQKIAFKVFCIAKVSVLSDD